MIGLKVGWSGENRRLMDALTEIHAGALGGHQVFSLHLETRGSGRRIVLVHGGARGGPIGGLSTFTAQLPLAGRGCQLVLPDRPGHGYSPAVGREDLEVDATWVAELIGDGAHLVGHSYGATIALSAAALAPDDVRSLTLIEAPVFSVAAGVPAADRLAGEFAAAVGQPDELIRMLEFVRVAGIPLGVLQPYPHPGQVMAMARSLKAMRDPITWNAAPALAAVAAAGIPALIVTGGWSPGFEAIGDRLAEQLHARRLVIAAGHHLPHLASGSAGMAAGEEFNSALIELIGSAG
jgi:pimeloyl-ACP methyl ester carboxylesterase